MSPCHVLRSSTIRCLLLCGILLVAFSVQAKRIALVMGNDNYASVSKLQKAGNDADAMARELTAAGFTVTKHRDLNYRSMVKAIDAFSESITGGDEVVVFYAGHGVQIKAGAYLLPVDIEAENEAQVERTSYGLNDLTERLSEAKPAFTLVMVDACRDNPMKVKGRAVGNARGLNALEPPKGQMVVYSASRGQQALDRLSDNDTNPNGVFTREFITRMRTPGVKIDDLMRDVQDSVESLAKTVRHEQRPAVYNEARGNFYFYGPTTVQVQQGNDDSEAQTWAAAQAANSVAAYQTYLDAYPKGKYVVAAKIKLDAIKQNAEKPSSDTEAGLWAEVKATGTRDYLETYVEQYPKGRYVALARLELKKLDDADKAKNAKLALEAQQAKQREEQQAQRLEQAAWVEAQKADTTNSYTAYLEKYPSGRFATQAKAAKQALDERIAAGKRVEEERVKAELVKKAEQERLAVEAKKTAEERAKAEASKKVKEEQRVNAELAKNSKTERLAAEARRAADERASAEASNKVQEYTSGAEVEEVKEQRISTQLAENSKAARRATEAKKVTDEGETAGPIRPEMAVIPAGSFMMGSKSAFLFGDGKYPEEKPQHLVKIPSFLMGKTEVTQGQWKSVMGSNPSRFKVCGDACPVEQVSWNDVQDFIRKLNQSTGQSYRLPSEAEWEYAARAGTTTEWSFGGDEAKLRDHAWYAQNSGGKTHEVGQRLPNAFGLHDMHGNAWEWTQDCWHESYAGAPTDGSAWTIGCSGSYRAIRGGSWNEQFAASLRVAYRNRMEPEIGSLVSGFRLASDLPEQAPGIAETKKRSDAGQQVATPKKSGEIIKDCYDCPEMVSIAAGSFVMGSEKFPEEGPPHEVNIPMFWMGKTEVTRSQWKAAMNSDPSKGSGWSCGSCPVDNVSWEDVQLYISKLNKQTSKRYRLPTEAEWEYAARAGTDVIFVDNTYGTKGGDNSTTTDPVARQKPNAFGLFDMHGNVWEWVADCWHESYAEAPADGSAWLSVCMSSSRVLRGGSKFSQYGEKRSATRINYPPDTRVNSFGFRLARNP